MNWVSYAFSKKRVETSIAALEAYNKFKETVQPSTPEVYVVLDTKSEDKSYENSDKDPNFTFTVYEYATRYVPS